jgi:thymidylate synthase ThyX
VSITPQGIQPVYDIEMAAPYHNYVANGFIVHNSTRYCSYDKEQFGREITFIDPRPYLDEQIFLHTWKPAMEAAELAYFKMLDRGCKPEMARSVLPNSLKTEIVVTANMREWRHILTLRTSPRAHPQMREVMVPLLQELCRTLPALFDDLEVPDAHLPRRDNSPADATALPEAGTALDSKPVDEDDFIANETELIAKLKQTIEALKGELENTQAERDRWIKRNAYLDDCMRQIREVVK